MFIDMNSFFASCEQQVNYYLRNKPVAVCVYPGKYGSIIAPSIEAKKRGIKTGMRLDEAMKICPDLTPLETNPNRYREYHIELMNIFHKYSENVIAKSIDEAVIHFSDYKFIHKDLIKVGQQIKNDIKNEVGDYLKCSIGIAPTIFLAKLASDLKKPDGLTIITPDNIDSILQKTKLTDLAGIAKPTALKLSLAGITSPLQMRRMEAEELKRAFNSIVGLTWHQRLNFIETENYSKEYKSMQAMRQISKAQRKNVQNIKNLLSSLCLTLEKRMIKQKLAAQTISITIGYENKDYYNATIKCISPIQEGAKILLLINKQIEKTEKTNQSTSVITNQINMIGINVFNFIPEEYTQLNLFDKKQKRKKLQNTITQLRKKQGGNKLKKAIELHNKEVMVDAIGFGSVKDLYKYNHNKSDTLITEQFED